MAQKSCAAEVLRKLATGAFEQTAQFFILLRNSTKDTGGEVGLDGLNTLGRARGKLAFTCPQ